MEEEEGGYWEDESSSDFHAGDPRGPDAVLEGPACIPESFTIPAAAVVASVTVTLSRRPSTLYSAAVLRLTSYFHFLHKHKQLQVFNVVEVIVQ